jgi:signal peptidase I
MITAVGPLATRVPAWLTRIESTSMAPTLRPGQLAFTTRLRRTSPVRRGGLVVVDSRELGRRIVKRVIGLPGDQVLIRDGLVYINEALYSEPYADRSIFNGRFQVPAGRYLLLGDNRESSSDSRTWAEPFISRDQIKGKLHLLPAILLGLHAASRRRASGHLPRRGRVRR